MTLGFSAGLRRRAEVQPCRETIKNKMTRIKLHRFSLEARAHTQHRWCQSGLDLRPGAARLSWKGARIRTLGMFSPTTATRRGLRRCKRKIAFFPRRL